MPRAPVSSSVKWEDRALQPISATSSPHTRPEDPISEAGPVYRQGSVCYAPTQSSAGKGEKGQAQQGFGRGVFAPVWTREPGPPERAGQGLSGVGRRKPLPMNVPWVLCPSADPVSMCEVVKQDWMAVEKEALGRNPASTSPF